MEVKQKVRRDTKVAIMFSPEMKERIDKIAVAFGMPPSTICSFAVASWVQQQENNLAMARMAVMQIARQTGEKLDTLDLEKMLQMAVVEAARQTGDPQGLLPLDPEESKAA
jgi:predicted transcriptional regulator